MLLAVDTCLRHLTLAVRLDDGGTVSLSEELSIGHAERIAPAFVELMEKAGVRAAALTRIGVTVGPGSFMGQRVGIAFAKGLALASGAETVPITTLEAFAHEAGGQAEVFIDARRGQVYHQGFGPGEAGEPTLLSYEEARARRASTELAVGNAAKALGIKMSGPDHLTAATLLDLTANGQTAALHTVYLRPPDAKPARRVLK